MGVLFDERSNQPHGFSQSTPAKRGAVGFKYSFATLQLDLYHFLNQKKLS